MSVNFELYKTFYYAAKNRNYSKAAEELFVTQSSVSQNIKTLESTLGTKLFYRDSKNMELTSEGKILYEYISNAFNFIKKGESSIKSITNMESGKLVIGASDTITKYFLIPFIQEFTKLYPNIKINIINKPSPHILDLVRKGDIDIGLINFNDNYNLSLIKTYDFANSEDIIILGNKYSHLKSKKADIELLKSIPYLSLDQNSSSYNYFKEILLKLGYNADPEISLQSIDILIELVRINLGFGIVPHKSVKRHLDSGEVFALETDFNLPSRKVVLCTNKKVPVSKAGKKFMDILNIEI
ncbi:MAG: LysR family transcriptional regulator [Firmicutes bacterium]|nr:LysR family transcriptional regulator [Bacillota bacterium]